MKKRFLALLVILTLAVTFTMTLQTQSSAIGLLDKLKGGKDNKTEQPAENKTDVAKPANTTPAKSSEPVTYTNDKYFYSITYPGNWVLKDDDPKKGIVSMIDENGNMGNISINSTWMSDNFPVGPAVKALEDKAAQRKKHGEVESYTKKTYPNNVQGVLITESDIDPDYKRYQLEAYGGGNYYNFCACTSVAKFPEYKKQFEDMINSIKFNFKK